MDINLAENDNTFDFSTENKFEKDTGAISKSQVSSEKIAKFQSMLNQPAVNNDSMRTINPSADFSKYSNQSGQFLNSDPSVGFDKPLNQSGQFLNSDPSVGFDKPLNQSGQFINTDQSKLSEFASNSTQIMNTPDRFNTSNTGLKSDPPLSSTQQNQGMLNSAGQEFNQTGINPESLKETASMRNDINSSIKVGDQSDLETFLRSQTAKTEKPAVSDLSSIFSSLMSAQPNTPQEISPAALNTAPEIQGSKTEIQQMIDTLVDKILVSDPNNTAGTKVMLQMSSDSAFARTEIVLTRSNDGTLAVVINSGSQEQYRKLNESKEKLESSLQKLEKGVLTIVVNPPVDEVQA